MYKGILIVPMVVLITEVSVALISQRRLSILVLASFRDLVADKISATKFK